MWPPVPTLLLLLLMVVMVRYVLWKKFCAAVVGRAGSG
jgi:hypothetical protein